MFPALAYIPHVQRIRRCGTENTMLAALACFLRAQGFGRCRAKNGAFTAFAYLFRVHRPRGSWTKLRKLSAFAWRSHFDRERHQGAKFHLFYRLRSALHSHTPCLCGKQEGVFRACDICKHLHCSRSRKQRQSVIFTKASLMNTQRRGRNGLQTVPTSAFRGFAYCKRRGRQNRESVKACRF